MGSPWAVLGLSRVRLGPFSGRLGALLVLSWGGPSCGPLGRWGLETFLDRQGWEAETMRRYITFLIIMPFSGPGGFPGPSWGPRDFHGALSGRPKSGPSGVPPLGPSWCTRGWSRLGSSMGDSGLGHLNTAHSLLAQGAARPLKRRWHCRRAHPAIPRIANTTQPILFPHHQSFEIHWDQVPTFFHD